MPMGKERPLLCRPYSLHNKKDSDDPKGQRTHQDHTKTCQGSREAVTAPVIGQTDPNESGRQGRNAGCRKIDPGRQPDPLPRDVSGPLLCGLGA